MAANKSCKDKLASSLNIRAYLACYALPTSTAWYGVASSEQHKAASLVGKYCNVADLLPVQNVLYRYNVP